MHGWQDIVLGIGSFIFAVALIPSVMSEHKPALWTSILSFVVLVVFVITYASLSLWYATFSTTLTALLWGILMLQKLMKNE
jgi:hypothetical protein